MWENLKAGIASVIRTNNNNEITGANLQSVLNNIVNTVGANATFAGMATPNTNPGSPDGPVFYFTQGPGLYVNFGNLQIDDNIVILANLTGVWQNLGPLVYESFTPADKSKLDSIESGAEVNVQSDWNQTNTSADDYIKNKPSVYTKTEIDNMLAAGMHYEVVSSLPSTGEAGTLYLVPSSTSVTGDVYDEYIWLPTEGQVSAHFEKIGTTKADLTNYYTKTEVDNKLADKQDTLTFDTTPTANSINPVTSGGIKTALDAKQPNISITTNTSTPTDNDTVIMQASGTTNTTSFLRRTMSKIWDYIKSKADSVYIKWDNFNISISQNILYKYSDNFYDLLFDDTLYGADERFSVTGNIIDMTNDETVYTISEIDIKSLFNNNTPAFASQMTENRKLIISIKSKTEGANLLSTTQGYWFILFESGHIPNQAPLLRLNTISSGEPWKEYSFDNYVNKKGQSIGFLKIATINTDTAYKEARIEVIGGESLPRPLRIINIEKKEQRRNKVTKSSDQQDLYGEVIAPKFTKRDGTSQQVLLADGTTINMPSTTGTNKDTLLKNLISGLLVPGTPVSDTMEIITSSAGSNGFNTSNYVNNAYKRPMSSVWDYIKGKADNVYTQKGDVYTVNMSSDSNHQGTNEYRVLATLATADCCVLNIIKTIYGYPSQNTVWFANQNSVSLISLSDFGFVAIGGRSGQSADLCVPVLPTGHPAVEYKVQIVRSTDSESVTFPSSATYKTYSRPMKANVVMRDEISTDAVTFNITGGTGNVSLEDSNDFIGNVTDSSTSAGITVTNYEQGQCYRFTFTEELEGVTLYSSNSVALCTVNETIQKGDVLTFTSVSNTAGGWMYSKTGASIKSSDGSVGIQWEDGVADLSVPVTPPNVVLNRAELGWENDDTIAIGYNSVANCASGDEDFPYAYTANGMLEMFKVDGGTSEYYHEVTAGITYSITRGNTTISFTPTTSGKAVLCNLRSLRKCLYIFNKYNWNLKNSTSSVNMYPQNMTEVGTSQYWLCVVGNDASMLTSSVVLTYWYKTSISEKNLAIGKKSSSTSNASTAVGNEAGSFGSRSIAVGDSAKAYNAESVMIGSGGEARGSYSTVVGNSAKASGTSSTAVGYQSETSESYGIALGYISKSKSGSSIAIGWNSQSTGSDAIAIGTNSEPNGNKSMAIGYGTQTGGAYNNAFGYNAKAGYPSGDSDYPYLQIKRFAAVSFTENGNSKIMLKGTYGEDVTITAFGTTITTTPPKANCLYLIVVNDSWAPRVYRSVGSYAKVNGTLTYIENINLQDVVPVQVTSNHYVFWFRCPNSFDPTIVTSFSFLCLYKSSSATTRAQAFGYNSLSTFNYSNAIGDYVYTAKDYQTVIGTWNIEDEYAKFIIGGGTSSSNRKNILTIDEKEIVHARAYISDAVTYELNGDNVALGTITMGLLKVTGGGTLTLTSTNAVEGHCVKVYASGSDITCNGDSITAGRWREYLFIDNAWRSKM